MKICYLRTDLNAADITVGGSVTHVAEFVEAVLELGHELFVIAPGKLAAIDDTKVRFFGVPPWRPTVIASEAQEILYNVPLYAKGRGVVRREKPDFFYQRYSMHNMTGILLSRYMNVPLVLEVNNSEVVMRGKYNLLSYPEISGSFEKYTFDLADAIVVVSWLVKRDLMNMGVPEEKITITPNAVNPSKFHPDVDGAEVRKKYGLEGKTVVTFVGLFYPWHGVTILAETIPLIIKENPDVRFMLIGDGNERPNVVSAIRAAGVEDCVIFPGMVPHDKVPAFLAASDILVSPHAPFKDFFGSPTKIFEYMGMGRPIVVSNMGQMGDIIKHDVSGLLVEPGDREGLRDAILRLAADPALRARLGAQARKDAVENFTWSKNAETVVSIYEKLMATGKYRQR